MVNCYRFDHALESCNKYDAFERYGGGGCYCWLSISGVSREGAVYAARRWPPRLTTPEHQCIGKADQTVEARLQALLRMLRVLTVIGSPDMLLRKLVAARSNARLRRVC